MIRPLQWIFLLFSALAVFSIFIPGVFWKILFHAFKTHKPLIVLLILGCAVSVSLAWTAGQKFDAAVFSLINRQRPMLRWLDRLMQAVTWLGNGFFTGAAALLLYLFVSRYMAYHFTLGALVLWLLIELMKLCFARPRPYTHVKNARIVGTKAGGKSFPSGHTGQAFFTATLFLLYFEVDILPGLLLYSLAAVVGFTRIYLGMHYPRDVLAGSFFGAATGLIWLTYGSTILELLNRLKDA
jgi:membrane-associated phospholipid phosphatase